MPRRRTAGEAPHKPCTVDLLIHHGQRRNRLQKYAAYPLASARLPHWSPAGTTRCFLLSRRCQSDNRPWHNPTGIRHRACRSERDRIGIHDQSPKAKATYSITSRAGFVVPQVSLYPRQRVICQGVYQREFRSCEFPAYQRDRQTSTSPSGPPPPCH